MSVIAVREIGDPREGSSDGISNTEMNRAFRVTTNSPYDDINTIFGSGRLPNVLDQHPNNLNLRARNASARQEKSPKIWIATIKYDSTPIPQKLQDQQSYPNPLLRPARVSGAATAEKKLPTKGYFVPASTGLPNSYVSPIVNSALDEYDSRPEIDHARWGIHIEKYYNPIPSWVWDYENGLNNGDVTMYGRTFSRGTLKISGLKWGEFQEEQGIWYYPISFDIYFKRALSGDPTQQGWYYTLPDRGYKFLATPGDPTTKKDIRLKDDSLPKVPQLLNGNGGVLTVDPTSSSSAAFYRTWVTYNEVDYSVLPQIPLPPTGGP
jgi:hypothetical protein